MSLSLDEELELERLLLLMEHWDKIASPPMPALQPPAAPETNGKKSKPSEPSETKEKPQKGFLDQWCDKFCPGSDRPSGKMLGKDSWMG